LGWEDVEFDQDEEGEGSEKGKGLTASYGITIRALKLIFLLNSFSPFHVYVVIHSSIAVQPFVGPWPLLQF
jgi:hypothetical protein